MSSSPARPLLPLLLALLALVVGACGGEEEDPAKLIAQSRAAEMTAALDRVERDLRGGNCDRAGTGAQRLRAEIGDLPQRTDAALVSNLTEWADHLDARLAEDCIDEDDKEEDEEETPTPTPTETPDDSATPEPTPAETPDATPTSTPAPTQTATPAPTATAQPEEPPTGGFEPDEEGPLP